MTTNIDRITVGGVPVDVVRKSIRNLHLGVYPPDGHVRVAAPLAMTGDAILLALVSRLSWIKRQQARYQAQPRQSAREMVSGESHYVLGKRYRLHVVEREGPARLILRAGDILELQVRRCASKEDRAHALQHWYRQILRECVPPLLAKWQTILGVEATSWGVRAMRTKWGTCNAETGRIVLNLELAKKPAQSIEYVVVHELSHLIERRHGARFVTLMNREFPHWPQLRHMLNAAPLVRDR